MNKIMGFFLIVCCGLGSAHGRGFQRITIPGAKCGSGLPYSVFYHQKNPKKLAVEFMGGGACWDAATCYGKKMRAWMFPMPRLPHYSLFTLENQRISPLHDHSIIYFPYCTGDVHLGAHTARYRFGLKAHHHGAINIKKAIEYMTEQGLIAWDQVENFVSYGASAGALAAMVNMPYFEKFLLPYAQKTLLADSPGLHWGEKFWQKFPLRMQKDFALAHEQLGLKFDPRQGNMAKFMGQVCRRFGDWSMGLMQSSRDWVMSELFGNISQDDHESMVFSADGLIAAVEKVANCSVWVPRMSQHVFLLDPFITRVSIDQVNFLDYSFEVMEHRNVTSRVDWQGAYLNWPVSRPNYVFQY